jgi:uncharacterized membrane protein
VTALRDDFLARLRTGLHGLPEQHIEDAVADYASHFDEARAAGRDEAQVALALGDPLLLAEQLRLAIETSSWETSHSPRSGGRVVAASFRHGAAQLLVVIAVPATLGLMAAATWLAVDGASLEIPGGTPVTALAALGLFAAALSLGAAAALATRFIVNRLAGVVRRRLRIPSNYRSAS